ncbi:DUF4089 domain-containing protein [Sphingobium sp. BYY-5]|uniref:DUF4089 domain-containing protein n=1 Tax=Sphingobium sp. BYY-5 TaxID=2926400 RepID=UPI001FA7D963|nr:DUF4089 domain-containing protein [Sphingobium sp. BYY-5]MCI4592594.1 DUF4089 domain-containing protein [Sphingobium sp. BYY-5]
MSEASFVAMQPGPIPRSENEIAAAAAARGLTIPDLCLAGVIANLDLLAQHADRLFGPDFRPCA